MEWNIIVPQDHFRKKKMECKNTSNLYRTLTQDMKSETRDDGHVPCSWVVMCKGALIDPAFYHIVISLSTPFIKKKFINKQLMN